MTELFSVQKQLKAISILFLSLVLLTTIMHSGSSADNSSLPIPDASLQPGDVVKIVINALADNDNPYPDAGIATTFNFASPANKSNTGPFERFAIMLKGPVFALMLNHKRSDFSEVVQGEGRAYQMVRLLTHDNVEVHFAFRLGLQAEGKYKDMWMTEAVWPLQVPVEGVGA